MVKMRQLGVFKDSEIAAFKTWDFRWFTVRVNDKFISWYTEFLFIIYSILARKGTKLSTRWYQDEWDNNTCDCTLLKRIFSFQNFKNYVWQSSMWTRTTDWNKCLWLIHEITLKIIISVWFLRFVCTFANHKKTFLSKTEKAGHKSS